MQLKKSDSRNHVTSVLQPLKNIQPTNTDSFKHVRLTAGKYIDIFAEQKGQDITTWQVGEFFL